MTPLSYRSNQTDDAGRNTDDTLPLVRSGVKRILTRSQAFCALPKEERAQLAHDMVKIARYVVDAGGETRDVPMAAGILPSRGSQSIAQPLAGGAAPVQPLRQSGGSLGRGVDAFGDVVDKADFPGFVRALVEGVFDSVVSASIKQMEAYATLVANVAKTADQYMRDNVSEDQARDWLLEKYPDHLEADFSGDQGILKTRSDVDDSTMPDFMKDLGLPFPIDDLDDDVVEEQLVPHARKRMAMDRQQLLATMVLMGINRIVVTDGKISASVVFDLDVNTMRKRHKERTTSFEYNSKYKSKSNPWFSPSRSFESTTALNVDTKRDSDAEDETDLKVKMKGNVDLRFKSETFPLERMVDMLGLNQEQIQQRSTPQAQPRQQQQPGLQPPPPPPLPQA
jgi:hypothetical protein